MSERELAWWMAPWPLDECVHCGAAPLNAPDAELWRKCPVCEYSIGPNRNSVIQHTGG